LNSKIELLNARFVNPQQTEAEAQTFLAKYQTEALCSDVGYFFEGKKD